MRTPSQCTPDNANAFAAWAAVYDRQDNPLLALEERILAVVLPDSRGRHVLDVGCGTGRWLSHFAHGSAASLIGIDGSREMLDVASAKSLLGVHLVQAELPSIPVENSTADLVIASFVLSYVADIERCACELARVTRSGGDLFLSDMHPATAAHSGWKRGFHHSGQTYELAVHHHRIADLIDTLGSHGFILVAIYEPEFGEAERDLLRMRGKEEIWRQTIGKPPIYILHFHRLPGCLKQDESDHVSPSVSAQKGALNVR